MSMMNYKKLLRIRKWLFRLKKQVKYQKNSLLMFLYLRAEINQADTEGLNGVMAFTANG